MIAVAKLQPAMAGSTKKEVLNMRLESADNEPDVKNSQKSRGDVPE